MMETLNLTMEDPPQEPREYKPKLFNQEQRKIYRDEISPLTDAERKALQATISGKGCLLFLMIVTAAFIGGLYWYYGNDSRTAVQCSGMVVIGAVIVVLIGWHGNVNTRRELAANRKRIVIAPVLRMARIPNPGSRTNSYSIITYLSTKDQVNEQLREHTRWKERDLVETHLIYRPDGSSRAALAMTKVAAFKRDRPKGESRQQVFLKDEIVPLAAEDREKIRHHTVDKKRVIVAPLAELSQKTFLGKPTRFFASLKIAGEIFKQEIPAEAFLDLNAGDIVELQVAQNPGGTRTLLEIIKIADAPPKNPSETENH